MLSVPGCMEGTITRLMPFLVSFSLWQKGWKPVCLLPLTTAWLIPSALGNGWCRAVLQLPERTPRGLWCPGPRRLSCPRSGSGVDVPEGGVSQARADVLLPVRCRSCTFRGRGGEWAHLILWLSDTHPCHLPDLLPRTVQPLPGPRLCPWLGAQEASPRGCSLVLCAFAPWSLGRSTCASQRKQVPCLVPSARGRGCVKSPRVAL